MLYLICFLLDNKAMCRDSRIVAGAAATEFELARRLKELFFKEIWYLIFF